jgi:predicted signal transduction protein with EAL and GGDEF domain
MNISVSSLQMSSDPEITLEHPPSEAFVMFSDEFSIIYASNHLASLLQLPAVLPDQDVFDLLGASLVLGPAGVATIATQFDQITEGAIPCAFDVLSSHDTPRPIAVQFTRAGDHHWILGFEDLGARQAATDRVVTLALTDPLTGLGNRQRFRQSLTQALCPALQDGDPIAMLGRPFLIEGMQVNIGASLGIALSPQDGTTCEQLIKNADLALYAAKAAGRNNFHFFDTKMEHRAQERRRLELDLRRAVALRQFELLYQPQIDAETQDLTGLEAMVRWRHPTLGLLGPERFMPLAEEIGLLPAIGAWLLDTACQHARTWPRPIPLTLAVAAPQFAAGSLVTTVQQALAASQLPAAQLQLDVTEAVLLRNESHVVPTLHALRALGVQVGIRNFGTGYASLANLDSFPFDRIRMDHSLMRGHLATHRAIINAVAAFGTSLGISTTIDGIRSTEDLARLHASGRLAVTGLLAAGPISMAEIAPLLRHPSECATPVAADIAA